MNKQPEQIQAFGNGNVKDNKPAVVADPPRPRGTTLPTTITNNSSNVSYLMGGYLGKGAFARCHAITKAETMEMYACKIISKTHLIKADVREKIYQEISIHRELKHEFIVDFNSYFEDDSNIYIIMELCGKRSLLEMAKRRHYITEPEARYFLRQITLAVDYLHNKNVIHRDLKLSNVFITDGMQLKLGDFGLAGTIEQIGERKRTLCGTPNYIAPEILAKTGHSFEVDIWSIGCMLYTLLVGKPPFETSTLRDTYRKIKRAEFERPKPKKTSKDARDLIESMLQIDPARRPNPKQVLQSNFLTQGLIPSVLPISVLTTAPKFETKAQYIVEQNKEIREVPPSTSKAIHDAKTGASQMPSTPLITGANREENNGEADTKELNPKELVRLMVRIKTQIDTLIQGKPLMAVDDDDAEAPSLSPMLWIVKWLDYSDRYGFGYQLSDDSIGICFNDTTKIICPSDGHSLHYIDEEANESYHTKDNVPEGLSKKWRLVKYFVQYMDDNLAKANSGAVPPDLGCIARLPNLWTWFRTSSSVVMILSNGTIQINKIKSHLKIIVCPLLGAVSIISPEDKTLRTFKLAAMHEALSYKMLETLNDVHLRLDMLIHNANLQSRGGHQSKVISNSDPTKDVSKQKT